MNKFGLELQKVTDKNAFPPVYENLKPCLFLLKEMGFRFSERSKYNNVFVYEYEVIEDMYGTYSCEIMFDKNKITGISDHFGGAMSGIEGWHEELFNGEITNKEDLRTVLRLTNVESRIYKWNKNRADVVKISR